MEFLIQSGANLLAQAHNGKMALQLAQEENQHECATILTAATSKVTFLKLMLSFFKSTVLTVVLWLVNLYLKKPKGQTLCCNKIGPENVTGDEKN